VFPPKRLQVQIERGVGYVYLPRLYVKSLGGGGLIHQFGVWLGRDLKNRLLLLLLYKYIIIIQNLKVIDYRNKTIFCKEFWIATTSIDSKKHS
jgi:hypothetical protein